MTHTNHDGLTEPKDITIPSNDLGVTVTACTTYARHGEYSAGNLLVIQYQHLIGQPSVYNFGQNSFSDWANKSIILAQRTFGSWTKLRLAIPDVVLEYPAEWDFQDILALLQ